MQPVAVFDIDGVLADVRHRLHFVRTRPKDWDAFFAAARDDPPLAEGFALLATYAEKCDLVLLTGRPEFCRRDTVAWIAEHGLPDVDLRMRPLGDRRPATLTKVDLVGKLAATRRIDVIVDDDPLVVEAYRGVGLPVVHATWMRATAELIEAQERDGRT